MPKSKVKKIKVNTIKCLSCGVEMYSRAVYDFRKCGCSNEAFIDGGFDYRRCGGMNMNLLVPKTRYVPYTKQELYDDWNRQIDRLGVINGNT